MGDVEIGERIMALCTLLEEQSVIQHDGPLVVKAINMLREKRKDVYYHCVRVSMLSEKLASKMGLSSRQCDNLLRGCFLHDVGKLMIPSSILYQAHPLNVDQWRMIKLHPEVGADIIGSHSGIQTEALDVILHHHERWDGTGYPHGLKAEEIPLLARICAVTDAFDAMRGNRSYRKGMALDHIKQELMRSRGTHFDPDIVDLFLELSDYDTDFV
jgi:putative nucleotidyltransferase with HDIG domain